MSWNGSDIKVNRPSANRHEVDRNRSTNMKQVMVKPQSKGFESS